MWSIFNTVFLFLVSCCLLASGVSLDRREAQAKCPACSDRSAYKEITKKTIKAEILRKLGFSSAPNVTGEDFSSLPVVKKQIEELRRLESEEGFQNDYVPGYYHQFVEDDFNFQPETITIMPTTPPVHLDYSVLYFKLSEKVIDAKRDLV